MITPKEEVSVSFPSETLESFVVVVGESLDPGDDRDEKVDEGTGDSKTGNDIVRLNIMFN